MLEPEKSGLSTKEIWAYALSLPEQYSDIVSLLCLEYFKLKDYAKALQYGLKGAALNQPASLVALGYMFESGVAEINLAKNLAKAFEYYQKAAMQENITAMSNLGFFYMHGYGCKTDFKQAKELLEKALAAGNKLAAYNLSVLFDRGLGVDKNPDQSFKYLKMAEEMNDPDVFNNLAHAYLKGAGVTQDNAMALTYFYKAIALGSKSAEYSCAVLLINKCLNRKHFDFQSLEEILKLLQSTTSLGLSSGIYIYALMTLFVDSSATDNCLELLNISQQSKPYSKSGFTLKLLTGRKTLDRAEIIFLLTHEVKTEAEKHAFFKLFPKKMIQSMVADPLTSSASATVAIAKPIMKDQKTSAESKWKDDKQRIESLSKATANVSKSLMTSMHTFMHAHKKSIDIHQFNHLIGKLLTVKGVSGSITQSKGSNLQYSIKLPTDNKTLTFSYHPTHRGNTGKDKDYDPKRRDSMQAFVRDIAVILPKPNQSNTKQDDQKSFKQSSKFMHEV